MGKMPLCYLGNPILRKRCAEIQEITPEIRQLAEDMLNSIFPPYDTGLAAPQVGHSVRMFVTKVTGDDGNWQPIFGEGRVFINPVLSEPSDEQILLAEGCLSIPGVFGELYRPASITIEAMDLNGNMFKERASGYLARVYMHENDHLNGVLFFDRMSQKEKNRIEQGLQAVRKKFKTGSN